MVNKVLFQKYLGLMSDSMSFNEPIKRVTSKFDVTIVLLHILHNILSQKFLLLVYKSFFRSLLNTFQYNNFFKVFNILKLEI